LDDQMARFGRDEPPPGPADADPILAVDLTTHAAHFMGAARNRLLLYEEDGQAYLRAVGTWDPMPWYVDQGYRRAGYEAQQAFWGVDPPARSMLRQIALAVARESDDGAGSAAAAGADATGADATGASEAAREMAHGRAG